MEDSNNNIITTSSSETEEKTYEDKLKEVFYNSFTAVEEKNEPADDIDFIDVEKSVILNEAKKTKIH